MLAANIIKELDKLIQLHRNLSELALKKTETIKCNDIETLNKLLQSEQKYIKAIDQIEKIRQTEVEKLLQTKDIEEENLFQELLSIVSTSEKKRLIEQREQLLQVIHELKERNQLNQQLIYHSLQYINISFDMLRPQQQEDFNYSKSVIAKAKSTKNLMFDSRV